MKHLEILNSALLRKAAMSMDPGQFEPQPMADPESKYLKRRRLLARVLPALMLGLVGGAAGRGAGKTQDFVNSMRGGEPTNNALKGMLAGGLGGAALGYGGGALASNAREWAGADPMLNTVAMGKG